MSWNLFFLMYTAFSPCRCPWPMDRKDLSNVVISIVVRSDFFIICFFIASLW